MAAPRFPAVPRLEPGDQLTRAEFERRYDAMPHVQKAELIEGIVHMPSPVRWLHHGSLHADLIGWLYTYRAGTPGVRVGVDTSIRLDLDNEPQPDDAMIVEPTHGGQARISQDDYLEGAPELVAEIAASSVSIDLHTKLRVYRRNQVQEYIVWRVLDQTIDWFIFNEGQYDSLPLNSEGIYQSRVFPGLWLDPAAMIRPDPTTVLQVLQRGVATPEHAAFVARLQQVAKG